MALKHDTHATDCTVVHQWAGGLTWMAHPNEEMQRASHALVDGTEVWLVDPLDATGLDETLDELGTVTGIVVLTNSHGRDADRLATRYDVPIYVPQCFDRDAHPITGFTAPVERFDDALADTGYTLVWQKDGRGWKEGALYHSDHQTLVIPDTLVTTLFTKTEGRLEVLPFFRLSPPRDALGDLAVERVLIGHGEPVVDDAQARLDTALAGARKGAIRAIIGRGVPTFARIAYGEIRGRFARSSSGSA